MSAPKNNLQRPKYERYYSSILVAFIGFCIADLLILNFRDLMLPKQIPPARPQQNFILSNTGHGSMSQVIGRNIFASNGKIPEALVQQGENGEKKELPPIPTTLPLKLIGTLVHSNAEKSIAAIEVKGKNQTIPYQIKKDIENMGTVERIERQIVYIRNNQSGRLEYLEMEKNNKVNFGAAPSLNLPSEAKADIKKVADNTFELSRADLNKYTQDLPSVLMQARMVPARKPTGDIYGFRFVDIQPNSVYTQMGFQPMDVITCVNGTPVTSPTQAMELYQALKSTASSVKVCVERNGKNETNTFNIKN